MGKRECGLRLGQQYDCHLLPGWNPVISLGVIGEYVGKIYMETKARPRFIIAGRTEDEKEELFDGEKSQIL